MNILVVYFSMVSPLRSTIHEHLYSFGRYSGQHVHYLNVAIHGLPRFVTKLDWDLVVYHTSFLSIRWGPELFQATIEKVRGLKDIDALKIGLPQDEFVYTKPLNDFLREFGVDVVFSVSPPSEWPKIYPGLAEEGVEFHEILTGYLDERTVARLSAPARIMSRPIDVGYRAYNAPPWLGRHGLFKTQVAKEFLRVGPGHGLHLDVSLRDEDTFKGEDWYRFLLRCRYTIGVEGGASLLDADGTLKARTEAYLASHPGASFEEVEAACFPGRDGELKFFMLSPRHLEACATRTCQVLIPGRFNGLLVAGRHYMVLQPDYSNLDEVCELIKEDRVRRDLTECAYEEIVASGRVTYRGMVEDILGKALGGMPEPVQSKPRAALHRLAAMDRWADLKLAKLHGRLGAKVKGILDPKRLVRSLRRSRRAGGPPSPNRVVTLTPIAVENDSRTYKQAASLNRIGFESLLLEGRRSQLEGDRLPFELRYMEPAPPFTPRPVRAALDSVGALSRLVVHLGHFYSSYAADFVVTPLRRMPSAPLYYMHAPYYLPAVWIKCQLEGADFIYDAHDFYSRMKDPAEIPLTDRYFIEPFFRLLEWGSVKLAAEVVTVGDGLAKLQEEEFGRPFVRLRNCDDPRLEQPLPEGLRARLGLGEDDFLIAAPGNWKQGLPYSEVFAALERLPETVHLVFLGLGHEKNREEVARRGLGQRIHLLPPVKPFEVVPFIRGANAGLLLYYARSDNYLHCLPNRFFQPISAGIPLLYPGGLPGIAREAERFGFGIEMDPRDASSVASAVERLLTEPGLCERLSANAKRASEELNWAAEEQILEDLMARVSFRDPLG